MRFFLTDIVARLVAAYVVFDCYRTMRGGLREGKIRIFNPDLLDWFPYRPADRKATPVQFWLEMFIQAFALAAGVAIVIFGWFPAA